MGDLPGQPNLSQLLEAVVEAVGEEVRVAIPGVIGGVSSDLSKASVQPAVRRNDSDADPVLPDVPLLFPSFGRVKITWPVESGDPCLLVFGDRSLEEWESAGGDKEVEPADPRTHDLSDAVAIPIGPGGASSGRSSDISLAMTNPTLVGAIELRLQSDGKVALGNSLATGTYRSWTNGSQNPPTPFADPVELLDLLTQWFEEWTKDKPGLPQGVVNDGAVPPTLKYYPAEPQRNLAAEIVDKLNVIKGSL